AAPLAETAVGREQDVGEVVRWPAVESARHDVDREQAPGRSLHGKSVPDGLAARPGEGVPGRFEVGDSMNVDDGSIDEGAPSHGGFDTEDRDWELSFGPRLLAGRRNGR